MFELITWYCIRFYSFMTSLKYKTWNHKVYHASKWLVYVLIIFSNLKLPQTSKMKCFGKIVNYSLGVTAWKVSKYGDFSGPYFPALGLNTERYFVSLHIQSECGKVRTRKNSVFGYISRSGSEYVSAPTFSNSGKTYETKIKEKQSIFNA